MSIYEKLIKLANYLDVSGLHQEADIVDECLNIIANTANDFKNRVADAINNTPDDYFNKTLMIRNPGSNAEGSVFLNSQTKDSLRAADWEPFSHYSIKPPAVGFSAQIPGLLGVVPLKDLSPDASVILTDPKGTGKLSATVTGVERVKTDYTVILLGPHQDKEVVWTFFPGEPIAPSELDASSIDDDERNISVKDAMELGLEFGKIVDKN